MGTHKRHVGAIEVGLSQVMLTVTVVPANCPDSHNYTFRPLAEAASQLGTPWLAPDMTTDRMLQVASESQNLPAYLHEPELALMPLIVRSMLERVRGETRADFAQVLPEDPEHLQMLKEAVVQQSPRLIALLSALELHPYQLPAEEPVYESTARHPWNLDPYLVPVGESIHRPVDPSPAAAPARPTAPSRDAHDDYIPSLMDLPLGQSTDHSEEELSVQDVRYVRSTRVQSPPSADGARARNPARNADPNRSRSKSRSRSTRPGGVRDTPWARHYRNPPKDWVEWPQPPIAGQAAAHWKEYSPPAAANTTTRPTSSPDPLTVTDPQSVLDNEKAIRRRQLADVPTVVRATYRKETTRDKVQVCPICHDKVTYLKAHSNARHLPWFVDWESACYICRCQLNRGNRREEHVRACHPGQSGMIPTTYWVDNMLSVFDELADDCGVLPARLPSVVRKHDHALLKFEGPTPPYVKSAVLEVDQKDYNPVHPRYLRDITHWRIVLRLLAAASPSTRMVMPVQTLVPEDGYIYIRR